ncbi:hypothetical protein [Sphingobium sp. HWE2-09]|uniref:hypothetical protein n=1 Tax=Sphingobium sp. HWE2-09 TaxID=3108390 RepID=UPI002DC44659|nr:hypothetical protein [Sphingobium sp. HWE2-09]
MGFIGNIETALHTAGIAHTSDPGSPLRRGWDYWIPGKPEMRPLQATDGRGIARTPHPLILSEVRLPKNAHALLDVGMSKDALVGGIWRQLLIRPGDADAKNRNDPFSVIRFDSFCSRAERLVAIVGHQPRDLALYYANVEKRDRKLYQLLLAKDFRGAWKRDPQIIHEPWPTSVRRLWHGHEKDYLPPFLVAVLYAETARAAMNQSGLIEMSVDGETLTIKRTLERLPMARTEFAPTAIRRTVDYAPFQSFALDVPDEFRDEASRQDARNWLPSAAARIALMHGTYGGINLTPTSPDEAKHLQALYARNPALAKIPRLNHGEALPRVDVAAFWGLTWRKNGAVRLLEIANTAREWNQIFWPDGPDLSALPRHFLAKAIAVIGYDWVAEQDSRMALTMLGEVLSKDEKTELDFENWDPFMANPVAIDDHLGNRSGEEMLKEAEALIPILPKPGEYGYTARSQAHLWLDHEGDDIAHYSRFQAIAVEQHARVTRKQPPSGHMSHMPENIVVLLGREYRAVSNSGHGQRGHNQPALPEMTTDPEAARGAQILGQQISPLSTDPMHAKHIRDRLKRDSDTGKGE